MAQRHKDAMGIAAGACNPLAIVNTISRGIHEIIEDPAGYAGTAAITNDPAIKHMVAQLAYICGVWDGINEFARDPTYQQCDKVCGETLTPTRSDLVREAAEARGLPVIDVRLGVRLDP